MLRFHVDEDAMDFVPQCGAGTEVSLGLKKDEIGRQMRSEYELPRELPNELSALLNNLLALPRRARFLNEGVKEIYLDLAANGGIQHVNTSCF